MSTVILKKDCNVGKKGESVSVPYVEGIRLIREGLGRYPDSPTESDDDTEADVSEPVLPTPANPNPSPTQPRRVPVVKTPPKLAKVVGSGGGVTPAPAPLPPLPEDSGNKANVSE